MYPKGLFLVMALILLLTGSVASAAPQPPTDVANPPDAVIREASEETIEAAINNTGAPKDPYGPGGYPDDVPAFAVPDASTYTTALPDDWETGIVCVDNDLCLSGDFNGDGKEDIAVLKREFNQAQFGDVRVAIAGDGRFGSADKWAEEFCVNAAVCKTGDFNGDLRADLVSFQRATGVVTVLLSTGFGFQAPQIWNNYFCVGSEVCDVGDFNGDNRDDIILFNRSIYGGARDGDVLVSLSTGGSFLGVGKWHEYFCIDAQQCGVGDFNGDNVDDIVLFAKSPPSMMGWVIVSLSTRGSFGASQTWNNYFCPFNEVCGVGDFDGDNRDDVIALAREGYSTNPATFGDVYVGLSGGNSFLAGQKWHEQFCVPGVDCAFGDVNGDGRDDLIGMVKTGGERGRVFVALASGTPIGFVLPPGNPPGRWSTFFCAGQEVCATGDFDGDNKDDILYFVRSSQGGIGEGDVFVSLSTGSAFGLPQKWHDYFCLGQDNCQIGDFNGDGRDDIVSFSRVANGQVYVALSTGSGFGTSILWNAFFCPNPEWCAVGDFNGDTRDDVITFFRNAYGTVNAGRVFVGLSTGSSFLASGAPWNDFFCIANEWCEVGDMNGDGRDDIVTFTRGSQADVFVGLSTGVNFLPGAKWQEFFCAGSEQCRIDDVNGDGREDGVTFLRSDYQNLNPATVGDVVVALSTGFNLQPQPKWNDFFCIAQEQCDVGDFNGDNAADIVAFTKMGTGNNGAVFVALRSAGTGFAFVNTPGAPEPKSQFIGSLIIRRR